MRKVLCEWNQEEIDELATETCECVNARIYTHKKSQKERAHNKIDLLFGENNTTVIVPDAAVDLLHKTVYPICEGFIQSATVDMGNGIKGKISITTKGIVKVTRTKTNTSTYEASSAVSILQGIISYSVLPSAISFNIASLLLCPAIISYSSVPGIGFTTGYYI